MVVLQTRFARDLQLKARLLEQESNPHYDTVFQALKDSGPEQEELLEVVLENLRTHHAEVSACTLHDTLSPSLQMDAHDGL